MQHTGTEIGQFESFHIGQPRHAFSLWYPPRIGRKYAIDIGPDLDFVGREQRGQNGRRVVAAVAPQCGDATLAIAAAETRHHQSRRRRIGQPTIEQYATVVKSCHRTEFSLVDAQNFTGIEIAARLSLRYEPGGEQARRPGLAEPGHQVQRLARQAAQQLQAFEQVCQSIERLIQRGNALGTDGKALCALLVTKSQPDQCLGPRHIAASRIPGQRDQRISDSGHCRDHHRLPRVITRQQQLTHMCDRIGIAQTAATKLVHHPGGHRWYSPESTESILPDPTVARHRMRNAMEVQSRPRIRAVRIAEAKSLSWLVPQPGLLMTRSSRDGSMDNVFSRPSNAQQTQAPEPFKLIGSRVFRDQCSCRQPSAWACCSKRSWVTGFQASPPGCSKKNGARSIVCGAIWFIVAASYSRPLSMV